jgi:actin-related protein 6
MFRINVGGKIITNHLKDIISHRQWNMMDETYLMNHVKEKLCYVSSDYHRDLNQSKLYDIVIVVIEYILTFSK